MLSIHYEKEAGKQWTTWIMWRSVLTPLVAFLMAKHIKHTQSPVRQLFKFSKSYNKRGFWRTLRTWGDIWNVVLNKDWEIIAMSVIFGAVASSGV